MFDRLKNVELTFSFEQKQTEIICIVVCSKAIKVCPRKSELKPVYSTDPRDGGSGARRALISDNCRR